jgi:hypothetical protein
MGPVNRLAFVLLFLISVARLPAQSFPAQDSTNREPLSTLSGTLHVYHQLREWTGVELSRPARGEKIIQLIFLKPALQQQADSLDGCNVRVTGSLYESPTGYYSANLAISDPTIDPSADCHPKPKQTQRVPLDPADLRSYKFTVVVNIPTNVPMTGHAWRTDGKTGTLEPWSAYADLTLTGGFYLWADCRKGFSAVAASSSTGDRADLNDAQAGLEPSEEHLSRFTITCRKD